MQATAFVKRFLLGEYYVPKFVLVMKLIIFLILACCLQVSARGYSQLVTMNMKNVPVQQVFTELSRQTGISIVYSEAQLTELPSVSISVSNATIEEVINECLKGKEFDYRQEGGLIVINKKTLDPLISSTLSVQFPPPIDISGHVTDDNGQPVIATVQIKGTEIITTTNEEGFFSLKGVNDKATLIITGVNIQKQEIKINGRTTLQIIAKTRITTNDSVVVTAYGMEKRTKELGYSVAKVSGEDLNRTNPVNFLTGLTGKVSGLVISSLSADMTAENNTMLRGMRSINQTANNQPLFILNGSPMSFGSDHLSASMVMDFLNNLNPNDIESVTVLKGANGAALYGPEGVNGVILINTKKGDKGGLKVDFRNVTSFQKINYGLRQVQKVFGAGNSFDETGDPIYGPTTEELWGPAYNNEMVPIGRADELGDIQSVPYRYTDDRLDFWNVATNNQTNLSISQADSKSDFYLGLSHTSQKGLLPNDKQQRTGILFNTNRQFNNWDVRINLGYTHTNFDKGPSNIVTDKIPPHIPLTSYSDFENDHWAHRNYYYSDEQENPYERINRIRLKGAEHGVVGNMEFKLRPFKWLTITERPGITYSASYVKETYGPLDYSDFAKQNAWLGRWISFNDRRAGLEEQSLTSFAVNNDLLLSNAQSLGKFSLKTTLGHTIRQNYTKDLKGRTPELVVPVYNLAYGMINQTIAEEKAILTRFFSLFGTVLIGYKDFAFLELTGRNDWDSKLAADARSKNFYSGANTSLVLTDMIPSLKNVKWLTSARLRAALSKTANMNIMPYQMERILQLSMNYGELIGYSYMQNNPNPNIRPENIFSQEYGGSFSFFNEMLQFDMAYYRQRNNGLILDVINSLYSGASTIDNAGVYDNWGWEFDLSSGNLLKSTKKFGLRLEARLAINDNKVVSLPPVYNGQLMAFVSNTRVISRTGHHAFEFALNSWKRTPDGKVVVDSYSGMPEFDFDNPVFIGRTLPKHTASFILNFNWKNLNLYALTEYRGGNHQYNATGEFDMRSGWSPLTLYNNRQPFVVPNSVYDDGTGKYVENTDVEVMSVRDYYSSASFSNTTQFLNNASFIKLTELSLSYNFTLKSPVIKQLTLGAFARDLLYWYPNDNIYGDPMMIRGPGWTRMERTQGGINTFSNLAGSAATGTRLPGTYMFGFVVNVGF